MRVAIAVIGMLFSATVQAQAVPYGAPFPANGTAIAGKDSLGKVAPFKFDGTGALLTAGGGSSAATFGAAFPATGLAIGWKDGGGNFQSISAANPLPITGTISASNPSVSATGAAVPASATYLGIYSAGTLVGMSQPLTDAQLRATAVPVSGTFWQATQPVSGTFWQATQPVSGTVTATGSGNFTVVQPTGTNLHVVVDTAPTTAVTGPLTDAQLGARVNTLGQKTMANSTPITIASDQSAISTFNGTIDAGNSSTTPLGAGGVFTGTAFDTFNFGAFSVQVFSNVSSAAGGLSLQFSNDGTNWDESDAATFTSGGNAYNIQGTMRARYFRVVYTNGGGAQATFRLQTLYKNATPSGDVLEITDPIVVSGNHAQLVRAFATGFAAGGTGAAINGTLKAASTAAAATDTALVVAVRDTVTVAGTVTANLGTIAGVATETTLSSINTKTPALGQAVMASSTPVVIASNQSAVPISAASLPLPTGAATEATLSAMSAKLPAALGAAVATAALPIGPSTVAAAIDTGTCTNVSVSATILASNAARKVAIIKNNGTAAVHVKLGATATTSNPPLAAGQSLTIDGTAVYSGVIDVIASTGTQSVCAYSW